MEIRGQDYPSLTAASVALGVTISCIAEARRDGRLATVGLYKKAGKARAGWWEGVKYPSVSAAARAAGIPNTSFTKLIENNEDWEYEE